MFASAAQLWLDSRRPFLKPSTLASYEELLRPLNRFWGARALADVAHPDQVRAYQAERSTTTGAERVNHEVGIMKAILKRAGLWTQVASDYQALPEEVSEVGRALEPEEDERLFIMAASRPEWQVAYWAAVLAKNTTAAARELKAVRIQDVDLEGRMLYLPIGKNRHRRRRVPLNEEALPAARSLLERARELGATEPQHYLFPKRLSGKGNPYDPTQPMVSWRWAWRKFTRAAGLRGLRFHDLRHHAISVLGENGTPEPVLKSIAGHVTTAMMEHYSHPRLEAKRQAVASLLIRKPRPVQRSVEKAA